jgi:sugar phosphate isomerase/epimerase
MTHYSYILMDLLTSVSDNALRRTLALLRECGYEGVELNLTEPPGVDWDRLEGWLGDLDLVVPSFLTGAAYHDGLCLSSPDRSVRRRTVKRLIGYLDTAKRFDAVLVVGLLQGLRSDESDPNRANRRIADCLREVAAAAEEIEVDLVVEPVNHLQVGFNNSVAEVRELVQTVGSPALRPMVDTVHMNIEETSLVEPILDCGPELRHVHLCESNGSLFGTGHVNFAAVLQALDEIHYDGFASVKVYRGAALEEAAHASIQYLHEAHEDSDPEDKPRAQT